MDYLFPIQSRYIFFKKNDPWHRLVLINKKQTPANNLLKYESPLRVGYERNETSIWLYSKKESSGYFADKISSLPPGCKDLTDPATYEVKKFMDSVFPPKEWLAGGYYWKQHVSLLRADRSDIVDLDKDLLERLRDNTTRKHPCIDFVRRHFFRQCFDELIRQSSLDNQRRGLLLVRCRDELYGALKKNQNLYCSQEAYGFRNAVKVARERKILKRQKKLKSLEVQLWKEKRDLMEMKIFVLQSKLVRENRLLDEAFAFDMAKLKADNALLKQQLINVTTTESLMRARQNLKKEKLQKQAALSAIASESVAAVDPESISLSEAASELPKPIK